jgi:hypothetical protein
MFDPHGMLHLESWAGRTSHPVIVLKETARRYKIRLLEDCIKGHAGCVIYAPKAAVTLQEDTS